MSPTRKATPIVPKSSARRRSNSSYHHGDLKRSLISAAIQVLDEHGYEGFTLRKCAKQAGVSATASAHYFSSVSDLLAAVAAEGFHKLTEDMHLNLAKQEHHKSNKAQLIARAYIDFAKRHPAQYQAMFGAKVNAENLEFKAALKKVVQELMRLLKEAYPDDSEQAILATALRMWSLVHGFSLLQMDHRLAAIEDLNTSLAADSLEDIFFKTLNFEKARCSEIF